MKTIEENNKMIAEFMNYNLDNSTKEYFIPKYNSGDWYCIDELSFNESWDWLMEVVEKARINSNDEDHQWEAILYSLQDVNLKCTYEAVVQFIEWYNNEQN